MGILILLLVLLINVYWQKIKDQEAIWFPIKYVRVGGQFQNVNKGRIQVLLKPVVKTGFFSTDLQAIQVIVNDLAWVERAEVQRVWPDTIAIRIYEQQAAARWQQQSMLNKWGEVFTPENAETFVQLPFMDGPNRQAHKLFQTMGEVVQGLNTRDLSLQSLQVSERQSWQMTLGNGIYLQLGREQPMQRFWRFLQLIPILGENKLTLIKTVDMRYPNGFSILWKTDAPLDWGQQKASVN
jgi:cell division protein FtsQ